MWSKPGSPGGVPGHQPRRLLLGVVLTITLGSEGCVPVYYNRRADYSRDAIGTEQTEFVHVGITSKEEVLLQLGEPDAVFDHETTFVYRWRRKRGVGLIGLVPLFPVAYTPAGSVHETYLLRIEFGEHDVVSRLQRLSADLPPTPAARIP